MLMLAVELTVVSAGEDGLDTMSLLLTLSRAGAIALLLLLLSHASERGVCSSTFAIGGISMTLSNY
jgi:hypothetical protein